MPLTWKPCPTSQMPLNTGAMPLIGFRQRPFAAEVLRHREGNCREAAERRRILIPEAGQRVGQRALPAMAHALGEARLQPVVVGLAGVRNHPDDAVQRERAVRDVRIRIGDAGGGVERDVDVVLDRLLVAAAGVHVVDFDRRAAAELVRDADRALPAVRHVRVVGNRRLFLEIAQQAPGPVVDVAEPLQRLVVGRQRPVERVGREVGRGRRCRRESRQSSADSSATARSCSGCRCSTARSRREPPCDR